MISAFRSFTVHVQVIAPTDGAREDWETEIRRKIKWVVNSRAAARRHGVKVRAPGNPSDKPRDTDFWVFTESSSPSRAELLALAEIQRRLDCGWHEDARSTPLLRPLGVCGLVSPDGRYACIRDLGHEGPHGDDPGAEYPEIPGPCDTHPIQDWGE